MDVRVSLVSRPVSKVCNHHLDWGKCGLVALAAEKSVLLYRASSNDLKYMRTIEPGKSEIYCVKFHQTRPILAVAEKHSIYCWDCETSEPICNLKIDHVTAIGWKNDTLVILRKGCFVHAFDYISQKLLWKIDLDSTCSTMSIDPFHPFRAVFSSKKKPGFVVIESLDPQTQPNSSFDRHLMNVEPNDAVFHTQIPNLIVIVCSSQIVAFEYKTKSMSSIIQSDTSSFGFKSVIMSPFSLEILHVMSSDGSLGVLKWTGSGYTKVSDHRLNRALSGSGVVVPSPRDRQRYLYCSPTSALSLIQSNLDRSFVIKNVLFGPIQYTCYDCSRMLVCLGTEDGEIVIVNVEKAEVVGRFSVNTHPIKDVRFQGVDIVHFIGEQATGSLNIKTRQITRYDMRSGPAISVHASDNLGVLVHSKYAIGLVKDGIEIPYVFDRPIASVAPQIGRTDETNFVENSPNVAILLSNGQIQIMTYNTSKLIMKLTPPHDSPQPSAIGWQRNTLTVADLNGSILVYNFQTRAWKKAAGPPGITKIELCEDNILLQCRDGTVSTIHNFKIQKCALHISNVRPSHSNFVLCMSDQILHVYDQNWKEFCSTLKVFPPACERLQRVTSHDTRLPGEISLLYANHGFALEAAMWKVIDRLMGGPSLPLSHAYFGGKDEIRERLKFVDALMKNASSLTATMHKMSIKAKLGDFEGVSEVMLKMDATEDCYIMGAIAGALLSRSTPTEHAKEILKMTAVSMIQKDNSSEYAYVLLLLSGMPLIAVKYMQELGRWDESLEILKCLDQNDETKRYIRRCAHHWLDEGNYELSLLVFASIGDFHPVLYILVMLEKNQSAAHLIKFLEYSSGTIDEYHGESSQHVKQIWPMEAIRGHVFTSNS